LLGTLLLLGACTVATPQIQYLQLSAGEPGAPEGLTPVLYIDAVQLPDFLLRDALLLRVDEHQLQYRSYLRWAEPLNLGIQRVLAEQLARRLDSAAVSRFPAPQPSGEHWRIAVTVTHFEEQTDALHVEIGATIRRSTADAPVRRVDF
jgi:uncharacterized lipoprotein YmbA